MIIKLYDRWVTRLYDARVARGAEYLDQAATWSPRYDNWRGRVDLGSLNLDSPTLCVIGQLSRNFNYSTESSESFLWCVRRGFIVPISNFRFDHVRGGKKVFQTRLRRLNEAWRRYIIQERMRERVQA